MVMQYNHCDGQYRINVSDKKRPACHACKAMFYSTQTSEALVGPIPRRRFFQASNTYCKCSVHAHFCDDCRVAELWSHTTHGIVDVMPQILGHQGKLHTVRTPLQYLFTRFYFGPTSNASAQAKNLCVAAGYDPCAQNFC